MSAADLLSYLQNDSPSEPEEQQHNSEDTFNNELLINAASSKNIISPVDIWKVLSSSKSKATSTGHHINGEIDSNGSRYRKVQTHRTYHISASKQSHDTSLVDRGANGGIASNDVQIVPDFSLSSHKTVNIMGFDNHKLTSIPT